MSKHIQLSVADPCHENWDSMTAAEKGRFCGSCKKQVIDFTNMSDSQLASFFKKPSTGSVCGRFYEDQLDRSIEIPKKRIPWVKYFFQFVLPAFLLSLKASAQGTVRMGKLAIVLEKKKETNDSTSAPNLFIAPAIPTIKQNSLVLQNSEIRDKASLVCTASPDSSIHVTMGALVSVRTKITRKEKRKLEQLLAASEKPVTIKGRVVDAENNPIPFATVTIKESGTGIAADSNGLFELEALRVEKQVILEVSSVGFNTAKAMIDMKTDLAKELIIQLTPNINLPAVIINSPSRTITKGNMTSSVTTVSWWKERSKEKSLPSSVRLYPNPLQRNSPFNVEFENSRDEKMQLSIVNMSGIIVMTKTENTRKGFNRIIMSTGSTWPAGIYIFQMRNEKGQVVKKEKLIVQ
ncbi:MAG: T9SS type A sorting domain-containing protein [Bacteroidetes bacterium]|nr:MAG: T9SS type A sorting domain-containing protein [Bacteroidota bacterium]